MEILLVEDNPGDARLLEEFLHENGSRFALQRASRLSDAMKRIEAKRPEVLLLDLGLPDSQGLATLRAARKAAPEVPIVIMTGLEDEELAVQAVKEGAQDYLVKGRVSARELAQSVRFALERQRLQAEIESIRRGQVELEKSARRRLESVLDCLPVMVCLLTPDYQVLFSNRAFQKEFGEPKGRKCFEYCFGRSEPCEFCESFQVLKTNAPHDWKVTTPNGRLIHAFDFPFTDVDGTRLVLEMDMDITEQKQAEKQLQESEARYRALAGSIPPLVWTCTPEGQCDYLNQKWVAYTGIPEREQLGYGWLEQVHPQDREPLLNAWNYSVANGTDFDMEFRIRRFDGEYRWFKTSGVPMRDEAGRIVKWFGSDTDVQDLKDAEAELEQKGKELANANEELACANEELISTNEELIHVNRELARSNEELAQFAYVASHDLQEPLRKIVAFGDRLSTHAGDKLDDQGRDYLERMQHAALRMGQLIDSLLELSRVATRGAAFEPLNLNKVVPEVLADLEVLLLKVGGRVEVAQLPTLMADRAQMCQLFQNLVINALKFHRQNVPPVVRIFSRKGPDKFWELHVSDNGIGFEEVYLDRIFRPFQRLNPRSEYEGSGMGLAICKKIVARHGGQITAHSQPGVGSDFVVTLPAAAHLSKEAKAS